MVVAGVLHPSSLDDISTLNLRSSGEYARQQQSQLVLDVTWADFGPDEVGEEEDPAFTS